MFVTGERGRRGATIIETIVGLGALVIVIMMVSLINSIIANSNMDIRTKSNFASLLNTVRAQLNYSAPCVDALTAGITITPALVGAAPYEVTMYIPNVQSGTGVVSQETLAAGQALTYLGLKVTTLTLRNVHKTGNLSVSPQTEYYGQFYLGVGRLSDGFPLQTDLIGGVTMEVNAAGKIVGCSNIQSSDEQAACVQISCQWVASNPRGSRCVCNPYLKGCMLPGTYPTAISSGVFVCSQLGSGSGCPASQYLRGVGINTNYCAPLPVMTPTKPYCYITAGSTTWTVGANTCKADTSVFAFTNGAANPVTVTASSGPYGVGNFSCGANYVATPLPSSTCSLAKPCNANAQALSWTVGGNTCYNDGAYDNIPDGSKILAVDAMSAPSRGTANFRCNNGSWTLAGATCSSTTCATGTYIGGSTGTSCPSASLTTINGLANAVGCTKNVGACTPGPVNAGEFCVDMLGTNTNISCNPSPTIYDWQCCAPPVVTSAACSAHTCAPGDTNDTCCCPNFAGAMIACTAPGNGPNFGSSNSNDCGCYNGYEWSWTCTGGITQNTSTLAAGICP